MSTLIHSAEFSRPVRPLLQAPKFMNKCIPGSKRGLLAYISLEILAVLES